MKALRSAVSGTRNRHCEGSVDLDLTYITPRIIAMGYPASGVEKTYRNDLIEVSAFLNAKHEGKYFVYNLSGRAYDYTRLDNRVAEYGFPDHHPPPLPLLICICNDIHKWLQKTKQNVVAVHCMAGKGRTGVVVSCYMLFSGHYGRFDRLDSPEKVWELTDAVVEDFTRLRGQGVRFPSQHRYIYYFINVLKQSSHSPPGEPLKMPSSARRLFLSNIVLHGIPNFEAGSSKGGGCCPFLQVLEAPSQERRGRIIYNSAWKEPTLDWYSADPDGSIVFRVQRYIEGDILIRCFHIHPGGLFGQHSLQVFHTTVSTDFLLTPNELEGVFRLKKEDIDDAHDNKRFPATFFLDLAVADRFTNASAPEPTTDGNTPKMGWMIKQGGFIRSWKRRWFVLTDKTLSYFKNAANPSPLGVIPIDCTRAKDLEPTDYIAVPSSEYVYFKLVPPLPSGRTYYFGVLNCQEKDNWISAINRFAGGMPQPIRLTSIRNMDVGALVREVEVSDASDDTRSYSTRLNLYSRTELMAAAELQADLRREHEVYRNLCRYAEEKPEKAMSMLVEFVVKNYPALMDVVEHDGHGLLHLIINRDPGSTT